MGTGRCFVYFKGEHKVRDCPTRDDEQVAPNVLKDDAPKNRRFYALRTRGTKTDEGDDNDGNLFYLFSVMRSF